MKKIFSLILTVVMTLSMATVVFAEAEKEFNTEGTEVNLDVKYNKTAPKMDGKIATKSGDSKWITSNESRAEVYRMREEFDCILTSSNTVIADNPTMKHKFKCILDKNLRISMDSEIFKQGEVFIASKNNILIKDDKLDLQNVLEILYEKGICSVFVECGGKFQNP